MESKDHKLVVRQHVELPAWRPRVPGTVSVESLDQRIVVCQHVDVELPALLACAESCG